MEQVASTYTLINFLKRLRIIGHLEAHTEQDDNVVYQMGAYDLVDMTDANYKIVKDGYTSSRQSIWQEELLEKLFGRLSSKRYHKTI